MKRDTVRSPYQIVCCTTLSTESALKNACIIEAICSGDSISSSPFSILVSKHAACQIRQCRVPTIMRAPSITRLGSNILPALSKMEPSIGYAERRGKYEIPLKMTPVIEFKFLEGNWPSSPANLGQKIVYILGTGTTQYAPDHFATPGCNMSRVRNPSDIECIVLVPN